MESGKISIIIPVYNVKDYVARCLDSVLAQTYSNLEIICIDDGSKDGSGAILDEYAKKDERIRVFHIENNGVGNARNIGLTHVSGEWFSFVDADDWLEPKTLEILIANALKNDCSVSGGSFTEDREYFFKEPVQKQLVLLDSPQKCVHNFVCPGLSLNGMIWGKIYKTEKYGSLNFNTEMPINEDCLYTYELLCRCDRACVSDAKLYHWFFRPDSACRKRKTSADISSAEIFLTLLEKEYVKGDAEAERIMKFNYEDFIVFVFFHAKRMEKNKGLEEGRKICKRFYKDIKGTLSLKQRLKYHLAMLNYRKCMMLAR